MVTKLYKIKYKINYVPITIDENKIEKQENNFDYRSDYIKKAGINIMSDPSEEIEKLINFCKNNFE